MNRRGRSIVLAISIPIVVFAAVGGFMSRAMAAREDNSYQHLRIFEDVVTLITNNYVEDVDVNKVMHGAMHGLADGLDPDTAYLDTTQVAQFEKNEGGESGQIGIELTRQYYLRVIAARDGSPAARAGLLPGDYIRAIDGQSTRDTSVFEGARQLRGKPGTKVRITVLRGNAADPHDLELTREELPALAVKGRIAAPGAGYLRVAEFGRATADQIKAEAATLQQAGATRLLIDVRGNAFGDVEQGSLRRACSCPPARSPTGRTGARRRKPSAPRRATEPSPCPCWCSPTTGRPAPPSCSRARCRATSARESSANAPADAPPARSS